MIEWVMALAARRWFWPVVRVGLAVVIVATAYLMWTRYQDSLIEQGRVEERAATAARLAEQERVTNERLGQLFAQLSAQGDQNDADRKKFVDEVRSVVGNSRPAAIVRDGKCVPEPSVVRSWNELQHLLVRP